MKILPCAKRWNFPCVDLSTRMVRTCSRAFGPIASPEDVRKLGKNIFLNHPYMQKGRELMLKGEYQFDCRGCYGPLAEGRDGFRTSFPETLKQLSGCYGETATELEVNFRKSPYDPKYLTSHEAIELEVSFGNPCDLMCVYCNAAYSSLIEAEDRKWNEPPSQFVQSPIEKNGDFVAAFWQWMEEDALGSLRSVHLIGGETLFNNYLFTFLENMDHLYKKAELRHLIFINVYSNLNNSTSVKRFLDTVQAIHPNFRVKLLFSNESVGRKAEFIRYGMNWTRTLENVQSVLGSERIDLGFAPSFNSLSVSTAKEFLGFVHGLHRSSGKKFYCGDNYVPFPYAFSPFILPQEFLPHVDEALAYVRTNGNEFLLEESVIRLTNFFTTLRELISSNQTKPSDQLRRDRVDFARRIHALKERRNVDFEGTFPEYVKFYQMCADLDR